jgi:phenylpropionate dioxygenase-like ring-hydroxylating dioxygenase large terminal subunit
MDDLDRLLRRLADLADTPLAEATAMPPEMYRSAALYELERERLFRREWLCAGLAAEIPNAGDYLTFAIDDQPIFLVRGEDGRVRGFANVCLHRMMRLLDGRGSCRRIVCPYHAWTYGIDGRLVGAPHMKRTAGFEPRTLALPEIRTEVWDGWIYATLNEDAPSVARLLEPLGEIVLKYGTPAYVPVASEDYVWNTNWKLLTENFMEGYHLPVAHRRTVGAWFPADSTAFPDRTFDAFTYQTFAKTLDAKYGVAHERNTRLQGTWRQTSVMPTIYPTHMYVLAPDHLWYLSLRPKSIGEVHIRFGVALAPEVAASLAEPDAAKRELVQFFDRVNEEDRAVVEAIYRGAQAPLSRSGRLSWLEREIHDFIGYLARRLGAGRHAAADARRLSAAT